MGLMLHQSRIQVSLSSPLGLPRLLPVTREMNERMNGWMDTQHFQSLWGSEKGEIASTAGTETGPQGKKELPFQC